jgi:deoxyhypusine synthase
LKLPVVQGHFQVDDKELYRAGIERIYDIFITEDSLLDTDAFVREALEKAPPELRGHISTPRLHHYLGQLVRQHAPLPEKSFVATAAEYDVPIFTSSPGDSSIGMNVAAMKLRGGETTIDPDLDVLESTAIVYDAKTNGVVILGGGSPKNFYLQTQPTLWQILDLNRGGHEFVLQISTDSPQWGGLSGATPSEAISWGKVQADMLKNHVVLYSDSTVAAPLVFAYALSTREKRTPKRLFQRLPALYQALQAAHAKKHPGSGAMPEVKKAAKSHQVPGKRKPAKG